MRFTYLGQISQREHVSVFRVDGYKKGAVKLSALITVHIFRQFLSFSEVSSVFYYVIIEFLPLSIRPLLIKWQQLFRTVLPKVCQMVKLYVVFLQGTIVTMP